MYLVYIVKIFDCILFNLLFLFWHFFIFCHFAGFFYLSFFISCLISFYWNSYYWNSYLISFYWNSYWNSYYWISFLISFCWISCLISFCWNSYWNSYYWNFKHFEGELGGLPVRAKPNEPLCIFLCICKRKISSPFLENILTPTK